MKKICLVMAVVLLFGLLTGCNQQPQDSGEGSHGVTLAEGETVQLDDGRIIFSDGYVYSSDQKILYGYSELEENRVEEDHDFVVPDSVEVIESEAFSNLDTLTMGRNVQQLSDRALADFHCTQLIWPEDGKLQTIGKGAFADMSGMDSITLPDTVTALGEDAFAGSFFTTIDLGSGIREVKSGTFRDCKNLTTVTFSADATVAADAFAGCDALTTILLRDADGNVTEHSLSILEELTEA